ncbi:MAG: PLDc N-terminal domain-containing protein [Saprospiraceae bacterium]|nr:PLDc N-terminal domain-containing protein [Lewinella sp.]
MEIAFLFFAMLICVALTVVWVLAIIEIVRSEFLDKDERLIWLLLVILLPAIGTILYLMIGRKKRLDGGPDIL